MDGLVVVHGISPKQIAENSVKWDLTETVNLVDLVKLVQLW